MTAPDAVVDDSELNHAEKIFLDTVLFCHGVREQPTESEFHRVMAVMTAYAQQAEDNPPEGSPSLIVNRWLSPISGQDRIRIAAAAFVRFGTTKPNIFQVRAAYREIFGEDIALDRGS
jgi:hypothetical protein